MTRIAATLTYSQGGPSSLGSSYNCGSNFRLQSLLYKFIIFFVVNCYSVLRYATKIVSWPVHCLFLVLQRFSSYEGTQMTIVMSCYFGYAVLIAFGFIRVALEQLSITRRKTGDKFVDKRHDQGFVPLYSRFENFYHDQIYRLVGDCFQQPICSRAGTTVSFVERFSEDGMWTFKTNNNSREMVNMGSYNYLDLNQNEGQLADHVEKVIRTNGVGVTSTRTELGTTSPNVQLDNQVADFLNVEAAITFGMGFATNTSALSAIMGRNTLVLSDELNHCSIILGCKLSGAKIKVFKHNDVRDLEAKLIEGIRVRGRGVTKVVIIVEGIYSMEGTMPPLKEIIAIKKRYKCYLYLDEAHSIGALGRTGRGVTEVLGVDRQDVDILMGTFTKSFGAAGGYVAGRKDLIDHIRTHAVGQFYATSMAPPVVAQIYAAIETIKTSEGRRRIKTLNSNTRYFRTELKKNGFTVLGGEDSPVVPLMLMHPSKLVFMSRRLRDAGIASAVVGFPATPLTEVRVRFCLSAGHTRDQLDKVIEEVTKVGRICRVDFERRHLRN